MNERLDAATYWQQSWRDEWSHMPRDQFDREQSAEFPGVVQLEFPYLDMQVFQG